MSKGVTLNIEIGLFITLVETWIRGRNPLFLIMLLGSALWPIA